jgi:hypothetical protein
MTSWLNHVDQLLWIAGAALIGTLVIAVSTA